MFGVAVGRVVSQCPPGLFDRVLPSWLHQPIFFFGHGPFLDDSWSQVHGGAWQARIQGGTDRDDLITPCLISCSGTMKIHAR